MPKDQEDSPVLAHRLTSSIGHLQHDAVLEAARPALHECRALSELLDGRELAVQQIAHDHDCVLDVEEVGAVHRGPGRRRDPQAVALGPVLGAQSTFVLANAGLASTSSLVATSHMDFVEELVPDRHVPLTQSALVRRHHLCLGVVDHGANDQAVLSDRVTGSPCRAVDVGAVPDPVELAARDATSDLPVVEAGSEQFLAELDSAEAGIIGLARRRHHHGRHVSLGQAHRRRLVTICG